MPDVLRIARIHAWACRHPLQRPVATSFGIMRDRPAVFLRIEDADGAWGWGEAFANWPAAGAEHRVNLLADDVAPLLIGRAFADARALFVHLDQATRIRALQCGEPGPFHQVIAAVDQAAWDLLARRAGQPLWAFLGRGRDRVPAYASGIHVDAAARIIPEARAQGFAAFKLKVGFDDSRDAATLREVAATLRPGERLFIDANQAWVPDAARAFMGRVADLGIGWIEEPLFAATPWPDWAALGRAIPLAAGENIAGLPAFTQAIASGVLRFLQPDIAKWGGITGCSQVARQALMAGITYCPHYLGGGIGLRHSAAVLAAAGGPGLLEVDANPNPLRDAFAALGAQIRDGQWVLQRDPLPDTLPAEIRHLVTHERACMS